jgi:hypothetical protein
MEESEQTNSKSTKYIPASIISCNIHTIPSPPTSEDDLSPTLEVDGPNLDRKVQTSYKQNTLLKTVIAANAAIFEQFPQLSPIKSPITSSLPTLWQQSLGNRFTLRTDVSCSETSTALSCIKFVKDNQKQAYVVLKHVFDPRLAAQEGRILTLLEKLKIPFTLRLIEKIPSSYFSSDSPISFKNPTENGDASPVFVLDNLETIPSRITHLSIVAKYFKQLFTVRKLVFFISFFFTQLHDK